MSSCLSDLTLPNAISVSFFDHEVQDVGHLKCKATVKVAFEVDLGEICVNKKISYRFFQYTLYISIAISFSHSLITPTSCVLVYVAKTIFK